MFFNTICILRGQSFFVQAYILLKHDENGYCDQMRHTLYLSLKQAVALLRFRELLTKIAVSNGSQFIDDHVILVFRPRRLHLNQTPTVYWVNIYGIVYLLLTLKITLIYRWVNARNSELQSIIHGVTSFLHYAIDI